MKKSYFSICTLIICAVFTLNNNVVAGDNKRAVEAKIKNIITVNDAYVRETIPGTVISSAYMTVNNQSLKKIKLIGVSSTVSKRIEIHEHTMANGMMRMRKRDFLEIDAQGKVVLQPSGYHLMIFDLKQPLKQTEDVIMVLHFSNGDDLQVKFPVKSIKQKKKSHQSAHQHH